MPKVNKKRNKIMATATATVAASALWVLAPNAGAAEAGFKDVSSNDYFYEAVTRLQASHVIEGNADGTFRPYDKLTRAQAAKIIVSALGLDTANVTDPGFTDVPKGNFYYAYISALANQGIVEGYGNKFNPNDTLTRAQMAKMITLAYNLQPSDPQQLPFADVKPGDWFAKYVGALTENDITTGTTPTTFSPNESITRGQMAALVFRSEEKIGQEATISSITNDAMVTSKGTYTLTDEQKKWINPSNLPALQGAKISLSAKDNRIEQIERIELTAKGSVSTNPANPYANHVVLDGNGATVDADITVNGDYVTLRNMTINGDLHVGKGVEQSFFSESTKVEGKTTIDESVPSMNINGLAYQKLASSALGLPYFLAAADEGSVRGRVVFSKFQLGNVDINKNADVIFLSDPTGASRVGTLQITNKDVKVTLGTGTRIGNLILPAGTKPYDVIVNFEAIKGNVELVNGSKYPDTISSSNDGGTVEPVTPVAPSAPADVHGVAPTFSAAADGKITGLDSAKVYQYKLAAEANWINVPAASTSITGLTPGSYEVRIAPNGDIPASAATTVTVAASQLVEAVMLDGKDGVSSQDGQVETVRLKFVDNIDVLPEDAFTVPGFVVESIKVTDKNGRTSGPLYTQGEAKYITIRVTPKAGTDFTPEVIQKPGSIIRDVNNAEIVGIHVEAVKDQAAPVIVDAEFKDTDQNGADAGDQIVIKFSEAVVLPIGSGVGDLADDFTLSTTASSGTFSANDTFVVSGSTVTVTLGATTSIKAGMQITISNTGVTLQDASGNKAKPQKAFVNDNVYSNPKAIDIREIATGTDKLVEAVMLDGKDGVSSQDGQVETVRLKFVDNIDVLPEDAFTVPGFVVESIKVTDKNGRTTGPLYTQGEAKYITIRVTPKAGTDFTPEVIQKPGSIIRDVNNAEIVGIHVEAVKDQAAPVIVDAEFKDADENGADAGDQIVIQFSEAVVLPIGNTDDGSFADNFTLGKIGGSISSFHSDDQFAILGNTVTVTLGATTSIKAFMNITISNTGVTLQDASGNKAKPQKAFVNDNVYSNPKAIDIREIVTNIDRLVEAVMLDGKDGVSSQDGKVETIRLKFVDNINGYSGDAFSVPGFIIKSIQVTDKNGRTSGPLVTPGERNYITIRVEPKEGTDFTPEVIQKPATFILDANNIEIAGIHVLAKDQAAPVIVDAEYVDTDENGPNAGDEIVIKFSEAVVLPSGSTVADLVDDFTLTTTEGSVPFDSNDTFIISGDTVTVTLGGATTIEPGMTLTISNTGVTLQDASGNKAKPQKEFVDETVYSNPKAIEVRINPIV
ncbi:S-layer homology domain-containing protein [Cohnella sp. JJ-181]|uniref:S-layer homology domain-containing protein n=1 Tax=Cohnella rhizoplanae TaxID=2974897 RepID=UPI0022FF7932|nr:S-layer homology domain-containing protein [Cohnella sp. JJ-181]CAI6061867.1 hypothetical protein COHCIP112018_01912 [Cohnella sp. JJ-181]